jgi:uroporphyrin-III C-methyltransferase
VNDSRPHPTDPQSPVTIATTPLGEPAPLPGGAEAWAGEPSPPPSSATPFTPLTAPAVAAVEPSFGDRVNRWLPWVCLALCAVSLTWMYSLQSRLATSEEELTRRHDEAVKQVVEAHTMAKQAEVVARDMAGKMSLVEARLSESTLQRTQLEDLMQSLSRSRDENVLADIEAALRVAQQHSALTGSVEPLLNTLKQTDERLSRVQQPRLERVRRAVLSDLDRVREAGGVDLTTLTLRLDEVSRLVDELPLLAAAGQVPKGPSATAGKATRDKPATGSSAGAASAATAGANGVSAWWDRSTELGKHVWSEVRQLIRVTQVEHPEAALLAPDQAIYLRDNLRLRLLSARLSLLSRQFDMAQSDLKQAQALLDRYFDRQSRRVTGASELLRQTTAQARAVDVPRPTATMAAIAAATAGR